MQQFHVTEPKIEVCSVIEVPPFRASWKIKLKELDQTWGSQGSRKKVSSGWRDVKLRDGRNNSQRCWANIVASVKSVMCRRMQQLQTMLGPAVHRGKDITLAYKASLKEATCNASAWPKQCWKSCANRSNIVTLLFGDHGTKEMLGVVGKLDRFQTLRNNSWQQATLEDTQNMQRGVQTDSTCNI